VGEVTAAVTPWSVVVNFPDGLLLACADKQNPTFLEHFGGTGRALILQVKCMQGFTDSFITTALLLPKSLLRSFGICPWSSGNSANCHQQRLGPFSWKILAFQGMLILLELFYFVCSKAGQAIWHCWAELLKAFINVRSFVIGEDPAPQPAEGSTLTSVKASSQHC